VTLPPGRLKPPMSPSATGSPPVLKTIGIVVVASLAASAACVVPGVAIKATFRRTRSAASSGSQRRGLLQSTGRDGTANSAVGPRERPAGVCQQQSAQIDKRTNAGLVSAAGP